MAVSSEVLCRFLSLSLEGDLHDMIAVPEPINQP